LALRCWIWRDVDGLTRRERLLLAVDVKHDGVVPGVHRPFRPANDRRRQSEFDWV
jgi:hypothetical protein